MNLQLRRQPGIFAVTMNLWKLSATDSSYDSSAMHPSYSFLGLVDGLLYYIALTENICRQSSGRKKKAFHCVRYIQKSSKRRRT